MPRFCSISASRALILFLLCLAVPLRATAQTASVSLAWEAPTTNADGTPLTDLAGYRVYYGSASGVYEQTKDVGNVTTFPVTGLMSATLYFFVATAYDTSNNESAFSNEVSITTPPSQPPSDTLPPAAVNTMRISSTTTTTTDVQIAP